MWFKRHTPEEKEFHAFFKKLLGSSPHNEVLYHFAFIHKSKSLKDDFGHKLNNERLEYLGDAVLSAVVAEYLYKKYPDREEGFLTELRSKIVSRASLNQVAHKIGLTQFISYDKNSPSQFKSIEGNTFEALVGAIYLERGYRFTRKVLVNRILISQIDIDTLAQTDWNYKSKLIDLYQKQHIKVSFQVERTFYQGHDNRPQYDVRVFINGQPHEHAVGFTIKSAEQLAAEKTYKALQHSDPTQQDQ